MRFFSPTPSSRWGRFAGVVVVLALAAAAAAEECAIAGAVNRTAGGGVAAGAACGRRPCLPKCCLSGEAVAGDGGCRPSAGAPALLAAVPVYRRANATPAGLQPLAAPLPPGHFLLVQGFPCPEGSRYQLDPAENAGDRFTLLDTGALLDVASDLESGVADYCIDYFEAKARFIPLVCFPPDDASHSSFTYYPVGMLLSVLFLLATLFVYSVLAHLRNLHGLCLMCHVASLAAGYLFLAAIQIGGSDIPQIVCGPLGYIVLYAFLASFFWLNVMCFDIWWVFSGYRSSRAVSAKEMDRRKFIYYSLYSWGCPTVIFATVVIMESSWVPQSYIRPQFGIDKCWFHTKLATLVYFYLPLAIILICNLFFFIATTYKILRISKETKVLNHGESKRHDENERQRFVLYFKLFIVMGINWVTEVISFAYDDLSYLWYVTDMSNTLQGVLIFIIFVWKRKTLRLLNEKLCPSVNLLKAAHGSARSKVSPSKSSTNLTYKTSVTLSTSDTFKMAAVPSESSISDAPA